MPYLCKKVHMLIFAIILAAVNVAVVWSLFTIKAHIEKQTTIQTTQLRMLSKIAKSTGGDTAEINGLLSELGKSL